MSTLTTVEVQSADEGSYLHSQGISKCEHEHDAKYYLGDDPMAIFLVENRLFKVHCYFLLEGSEVFRAMFNSMAEEGVDPDGTSNERPIPLRGVAVTEFKALLDYFYLPPHSQTCLTRGKQSLQTYLDLLSISHRFMFKDVFQYAVVQLQPLFSKLPAMQRFQLGEKYGLREWLFSAYESLLDRTSLLSFDEAKILGLDKVVRYMNARESIYRERLEEKERDLERVKKAEENNSPSGKKGKRPDAAPTSSLSSMPDPESSRVSRIRVLVEKFFF